MTSITENGLKIREPDVCNVKKTTILMYVYVYMRVRALCCIMFPDRSRLASRHEDTSIRPVFLSIPSQYRTCSYAVLERVKNKLVYDIFPNNIKQQILILIVVA